MGKINEKIPKSNGKIDREEILALQPLLHV